MKQQLRQAIKEVLEAWETPDSPEAFACAMYQLRRIYLSDLKVKSVSSDVNQTYGRRKFSNKMHAGGIDFARKMKKIENK